MLETVQLDNILIVSSHTDPSMSGPVNHAVYCAEHGYKYLFDATPYPNASKYDQKLHAIVSNLPRANWLFWLDDDVYVMDHSTQLEQFLPSDDGVHFVVCDGRVNAPVEWAGKWAGAWTVFNAGAIFVRNSRQAREALLLALDVSMETVRSWWNDEQHGFFSDGDQDKLLYAFEQTGLLQGGVQILDHKAFNARIYHFDGEASRHFAVHLCGHADKTVGINALRERFGLDKNLLPQTKAAGAAPFERRLFAGRAPMPTPAKPTIMRRIARKLQRLFKG